MKFLEYPGAIIITTVVVGMAFFQFLILVEAYRRFVKEMNEAFNKPWFVSPKAERSYMRRRPGVMTVANDQNVWRSVIR